jgi:hypothetical protein
MRESGRSPLRWALRWWPAAVDLGLAVLVLIRRVNPYPLLALGAAAWALMGAPWA